MGNAHLAGLLNTGADPMEDPLADLPAPMWNPSNDLGRITNSYSHAVPGYYSGGIAGTNGSLTLDPEIYVLGGVGLNIRGGDLIAEGIMFYIVGSGSVSLRGNGIVNITPIDPDFFNYSPGTEYYEGISIFQARNNTNDSSINSNSNTDMKGTYYFPSNHLVLSGTADLLGNQWISDTLEFSGNGDLTITYDGSFPAPGNSVFLVQ